MPNYYPSVPVKEGEFDMPKNWTAPGRNVQGKGRKGKKIFNTHHKATKSSSMRPKESFDVKLP